jgi:hypothetical protein
MSMQTADGWIVGFDAGEFGGGLYWFNADGTKHYQINLDRPVDEFDSENVRNIFTYRDSVIVLQGLAHMSLDRGKVIRLSRQRDGRWRAALLCKLNGEPQVCLQDGDGSWIIVTHKTILRMKADGKQQTLGTSEFTSGLYPNSIARTLDGVIYLGMRHFVARLIPTDKHYRAELLVPTDLPLFDHDPFDDLISGEPDTAH